MIGMATLLKNPLPPYAEHKNSYNISKGRECKQNSNKHHNYTDFTKRSMAGIACSISAMGRAT
ncbi:MAG TPA: hypothetical protein PLC17_11110, partial [Tenuifilaceae bacterium]|nr:hypothetical protein [Tenuifilaceae bacterium]